MGQPEWLDEMHVAGQRLSSCSMLRHSHEKIKVGEWAFGGGVVRC